MKELIDVNRKVPMKLYNESKNPTPKYSKEDDACFDIQAAETTVIYPKQVKAISTGLHSEIPVGFKVHIVPRSGLAMKKGITVLNSPGTIDSGYRGEWKMILANLGDRTFEIKYGDRIAQGFVEPVWEVSFIVVDKKEDLSDSERGAGGFGSTGV